MSERGLGVARLISIGHRGRRRRVELGLEVAEVAKRMGMTSGRLYNLECYGAGMIATIERWAFALDEMDPRELAFGPAAPPVGAYPRLLWDEQHPFPTRLQVAERIEAIEAAIARRVGGEGTAREWLDELAHLRALEGEAHR
jgi:transcriptional regulator with XRE-family HTH domain